MEQPGVRARGAGAERVYRLPEREVCVSLRLKAEEKSAQAKGLILLRSNAPEFTDSPATDGAETIVIASP